MKKIIIGFLIITLVTLFSCSTGVKAPDNDEIMVMIYVEEIHKPVKAPVVELHLEGMDKPLKFKVRALAAGALLKDPGTYTTSGWSAAGGVFVNSPGSFEFAADESGVALIPYKITLVSKKQVDIRPMTALDIEYAKGQFSMNSDYWDLNIIYPEIPAP